MDNHEGRWPAVSSPAALRVLAAAELLPRYRWVESRRQDYTRRLVFPGAAKRYRDWLREALDRSHIAQRMAAEHVDELRETFGTYSHLMPRFRSYDQILRVTHLQLSTLLEPQVDCRRIAATSLPLLLATSGLLLLVLVKTVLYRDMWIGRIYLAMSLLLVVLILIRLPAVVKRLQAGRECLQRNRISGTELYLYLKESYTDAHEPFDRPG
jgi:hypothetical protein